MVKRRSSHILVFRNIELNRSIVNPSEQANVLKAIEQKSNVFPLNLIASDTETMYGFHHKRQFTKTHVPACMQLAQQKLCNESDLL